MNPRSQRTANSHIGYSPGSEQPGGVPSSGYGREFAL